MKKIAERLIRLRNPNFVFAQNINSRLLLRLGWVYFWGLFRGLRLLLVGRFIKGLSLGKGVRFFNLPNIKIGKFVKIGNNVYLGALGEEGLLIGNNVGIGDYSKIVVSTDFGNPGKFIKIGNNVGIGEFAYLGGAGGLEIGNDCIIGQYLSCHPENHEYQDLNIPIRLQGVSRKGIRIGDNCWIGSKVSILDGVVIGAGSIIAAGAVVNKSFPPNSIIGGVPAKLLKTRDENN
jgi:acetyltransferase-like isoleucine patch superfamily enzyme